VSCFVTDGDGMEKTLTTVDSRYVLDTYSKELDDTLFAVQSPIVTGRAYLRKRRKSAAVEHLFKKIEDLSPAKKETLISELMNYLPKDSSLSEFEKARSKLSKLEEDKKINKLLADLKTKYDKLPDQDKVELLKLSLEKAKPTLIAVREFIADKTLDAKDPEVLILLDQAIYTAYTLCDAVLTAIDRNQMDKANLLHVFLFFLLLSIEAIHRKKIKPETLYETIALITTYVDKTKEERGIEIDQGVYSVTGVA